MALSIPLARDLAWTVLMSDDAHEDTKTQAKLTLEALELASIYAAQAIELRQTLTLLTVGGVYESGGADGV